MRKRVKRTSMHVLIALACIVCCLGTKPQTAEASAWDNARTYYNTYGNEVVFCPMTLTDGAIFYATKATVASTKTTYRTLGWKVSIMNTSGTKLQTIYFKLGGSYMYHVSSNVSGKQEYNLYYLSLYQLKSRMNAKAEKAISKGEASIRLDACMAVVKNGKVQGSMSDSGPLSGKVYSTYSGIAGAANWNSAARSSLYSYFGKYVQNLFYQIDVIAGEGIKKATGSGLYCYGTYVEVSATPASGYEFANWYGLYQSANQYDGFFANSSGVCVAVGEPKMLRIYYHRNLNAQDTTVDYQMVRYHSSGVNLENYGWQKDGKPALGWSFSQSATTAKYKPGDHMSGAWINKYAPEVHLYAVWEDSNPGKDPPGPTPPDPNPPTPPEPTPPEPTPPTPAKGTDGKKEPATTKTVRCRFISSKYFEDENQNLIPQERGGLSGDSVWATDTLRRQILRSALSQA